MKKGELPVSAIPFFRQNRKKVRFPFPPNAISTKKSLETIGFNF
jgi:hypothetical protein